MGIKTRDFPRTRTHTGRHMAAQGDTCTGRDSATARYTRAQREKCCSHEPSAQPSPAQPSPGPIQPKQTKRKATAHRICNANKKRWIQRQRLLPLQLQLLLLLLLLPCPALKHVLIHAAGNSYATTAYYRAT